MKRILKKIIRYPESYIILSTICFRVYLAKIAGIWFAADQLYDDALLVKYSCLSDHFLNPTIDSLLKTMSYPLFLDFVQISHLDYVLVLSLVWIIGALLVWRTMLLIGKKRILSMIGYLYILFMPVAFELWTGTRLYRNSIIAPFTLIVFCLMIRLLYKYKENKSSLNILCESILLGFVFSYTFYIKEDGIWLMACLLAFSVSFIIIVLFKLSRKEVKKGSIHLCLSIIAPFIIFCSVTQIYKKVNYYYFGVNEIETRVSGELGKFVSNIYKIDSNNRTSSVWAPTDAIEKAFAVSPTLADHPKLMDSIMHSDWFGGNIYKDPIKGDFLPWVLRTSLIKTGTWQNEAQVNELFGKINKELEEAFANGTLVKDKKIQLLSSAGGRSVEEMISLFPIMINCYKASILLDGCYPGSEGIGNTQDMSIAKCAAIKTHLNYLTNYSERSPKGIKLGTLIIENIFRIYKAVNIILTFCVFYALTGSVITLCNRFKRKKNIIYNFLNDDNKSFKEIGLISFTLLGIAYAFSISWYVQYVFIRENGAMWIINFYRVALSVILFFTYMFGLDLCIYYIKTIYKNEEKIE